MLTQSIGIHRQMPQAASLFFCVCENVSLLLSGCCLLLSSILFRAYMSLSVEFFFPLSLSRLLPEALELRGRLVSAIALFLGLVPVWGASACTFLPRGLFCRSYLWDVKLGGTFRSAGWPNGVDVSPEFCFVCHAWPLIRKKPWFVRGCSRNRYIRNHHHSLRCLHTHICT